MRASFFSHGPFRDSDDRRAKIAQAMDACIRENGYAATSLTEIAVKAKMSPSHIRYYFDGKEEILEFYLAAICDQIVLDIAKIPRKTPRQWLEDFTAFFITHPDLTKPTLAVMIEIFAVSVHNPKLARIKTKYDEVIRKTLQSFFEWAGTADGLTPADAAYRAWALEIGLKFNAVFQSDFSKQKAGEAYFSDLSRMAGFEDSPRKRKGIVSLTRKGRD